MSVDKFKEKVASVKKSVLSVAKKSFCVKMSANSGKGHKSKVEEHKISCHSCFIQKICFFPASSSYEMVKVTKVQKSEFYGAQKPFCAKTSANSGQDHKSKVEEHKILEYRKWQYFVLLWHFQGFIFAFLFLREFT